MLSFGNTVVYVTTLSWHIEYSMKLCLNYANRMKMEGLRLREMGLENDGAYDVTTNYS